MLIVLSVLCFVLMYALHSLGKRNTNGTMFLILMGMLFGVAMFLIFKTIEITFGLENIQWCLFVINVVAITGFLIWYDKILARYRNKPKA